MRYEVFDNLWERTLKKEECKRLRNESVQPDKESVKTNGYEEDLKTKVDEEEPLMLKEIQEESVESKGISEGASQN